MLGLGQVVPGALGVTHLECPLGTTDLGLRGILSDSEL